LERGDGSQMQREVRFNRGELKGVGRRLRLLRVARGWSLKKLADVSGISVAAIRKIELGGSNPSLLTVLALVEALDEPVDRLIDRAISSGGRAQLVRAATVADSGGEALLSDKIANRMMAGRRITLGAGEALAPSKTEAGGALFGYVLDGEVVLSEGRSWKEKCSNGDSFHFLHPAQIKVCTAKRGAKLIVVESLDVG